MSSPSEKKKPEITLHERSHASVDYRGTTIVSGKRKTGKSFVACEIIKAWKHQNGDHPCNVLCFTHSVAQEHKLIQKEVIPKEFIHEQVTEKMLDRLLEEQHILHKLQKSRVLLVFDTIDPCFFPERFFENELVFEKFHKRFVNPFLHHFGIDLVLVMEENDPHRCKQYHLTNGAQCHAGKLFIKTVQNTCFDYHKYCKWSANATMIKVKHRFPDCCFVFAPQEWFLVKDGNMYSEKA